MTTNTLPDQALTLGGFLRDRRARLSPGPGAQSRRRTPGLRREEVATRAGVSVTWYIQRTLDAEPDDRFWIHLDGDVLDQAVMPAVDSPGCPGVDPDDIARIGAHLVRDARCCGMTVTVYDPDLDPDGACSSLIVSVLAEIFRSR